MLQRKARPQPQKNLRPWEVGKLAAEIMAAQMAQKTGSQVVWGAILSSSGWNEFDRHELLYEWKGGTQTILVFDDERSVSAYIRLHELGGRWTPRPFPLNSLVEKHAVHLVKDLTEAPGIFADKTYDFVDPETGEVSQLPTPWSMRNYNRWMLKTMADELAEYLETLVSNDQGLIVDACPRCYSLCPGCNQ